MNPGEHRLRAVLQEASQQADFLQQALSEKRTIAENRVKQCTAGVVVGERNGEIGERRIRILARRAPPSLAASGGAFAVRRARQSLWFG